MPLSVTKWPTESTMYTLDTFTLAWTFSGNFTGPNDGNIIYCSNASFDTGARTQIAAGYTYDFASSLPDNICILGLQMDVYKRNPSGGQVVDAKVQFTLYPPGGIGEDKADTTSHWPTSAITKVTYGGPTDLWGRTWRMSEICNPYFGVLLAAEAHQDNAVAYIDACSITVYYDPCNYYRPLMSRRGRFSPNKFADLIWLRNSGRLPIPVALTPPWSSIPQVAAPSTTLTPYTNAGAVTMTIASPCVVTLAGHGLADGREIQFHTSGALPTGLGAGSHYFVKSPATDTFNVSATAGGSAINTSGSQSGTHTLYTKNP